MANIYSLVKELRHSIATATLQNKLAVTKYDILPIKKAGWKWQL